MRKVLIQAFMLTFFILTWTSGAAAAQETTGSVPTPVTQLNMKDHIRYMDVNNGCFRPDDPLTRGEAARVFFLLLVDKPAEPEEIFSDVKDSEYYLEVNALGTIRIIAGNNGLFRPNDSLTRAEFAAILQRFFPTEPIPAAARKFNDVPEGFWGAAPIAFAAEKGWITGYPDGSFLPNKPITRAEAAVVMNKVLGRSPDIDAAVSGENIRIVLDSPQSHWAFSHIIEATINHEYSKNQQGAERWTSWDAETTGLSPGPHYFKGELYYINEAGQIVRSVDINNWRFDRDGRYTTGDSDLDRLLTNVLLKETDDDMLVWEKRRALFLHMRDSYSYLSRPLVDKDDPSWVNRYALRFFREGLGNCYSYAAAYGLLLRKIGYDVEFIVGEITYSSSMPFSAHGWVEINTSEGIRIDDPEFEMIHRERDFYDFSYETQPASYKK